METIKPQELRIGNLVVAGNTICEIVRIDKKGYVACSAIDGSFSYESYHLSMVQSIPITEERLLHMMSQLNKTKISLAIWPTGRITVSIGGEEIKYVKWIHEIQNIVYDFTGQEITLNS